MPRRPRPAQAPHLRIDRRNTFGARAALVAASGLPFDLTSGVAAAVNNALVATGRGGRGFGCALAQKNVEWNLAPLATSSGDGGGDFTVFALVDPASAASVQTIYSQKNDALGSPFTQIGLYVNAAIGFTADAGRVSLCGYSSGSFGVQSDSTGMVDGGLHLYLATRLNGVWAIYRDGVKLAATSIGGTSTPVWAAGQKTALGADANTSNTPYDRPIYLAGSLNMGLSDAQAAEFSRNPWQLFAAPAPAPLVPAAAGAAGALTWTQANQSTALAATNTVNAAAAWTQADQAAAAAGAATVTGAAAWTQAGQSAALAATGLAAGGAAWTQAGQSAACAAVLLASGAASWAQAGDAPALAAQVLAGGALAWTQEGQASAIVATATVDGAPAWTCCADSWSGAAALLALGACQWTQADQARPIPHPPATTPRLVRVRGIDTNARVCGIDTRARVRGIDTAHRVQAQNRTLP